MLKQCCCLALACFAKGNEKSRMLIGEHALPLSQSDTGLAMMMQSLTEGIISRYMALQDDLSDT